MFAFRRSAWLLVFGVGACRESSPSGPGRHRDAAALAVSTRAQVETRSMSDVATTSAPTIAPVHSASPPSLFFGVNDDALRRSLATAAIASIRKGSGGRSLGFKLTLVDGTVGYFKPEQSFSGAHWYSEVAAHYLDRELGIGRVPAVVGRRLPWAPLRAAASGDKRVAEVTVSKDGSVRGAFIAWVPEGLVPLRLEPGWESRIRVEKGRLKRSPYNSPSMLQGNRSGDRDPRDQVAGGSRAATAKLNESRAAELSDLIVFDYLISNVDRWGGDFTNVRTRGADGELVFFDNGAGFWPNARVELMESRLETLQRFRRSTIEALRAFHIEGFAARLQQDPLAPVLSPKYIADVELRRQRALAHIETMQRRYAEQATPW